MCDSAYSQLAGLRAHQRSARHRKSGRPVVKRSTWIQRPPTGGCCYAV